MGIPGISAVTDWAKDKAHHVEQAAGHAWQGAVDKAKDVKDTVGHVVTDVKDDATDLKDKAIGAAGDVKERAVSVVHDVEHKAGEVVDGAKDKARQWGGEAKDWVGERIKKHGFDFESAPTLQIDQLNSDGDKAVFTLQGEGFVQLPIPIPGISEIPGVGELFGFFGIGGDAQYGYDITVEQVGDTPAPGSGGPQPSYNVTFDKNLVAGGAFEPGVPLIDPAVQGYISSADTVTLNFATKDDAKRAVGILQKMELQETIHDAGTFGNPFTNPVADNGNDPLTWGSATDGIAKHYAPSDADKAFLQDHIVSYSSTVSGKERAKLIAKAFNLGFDARFDGNETVTRTVELPHDGQSGRLTYTLSGDLTPTTKGRLTFGQQVADQYEVGYVPMNVVDHGSAKGEISLGWDLPDSAFDHKIGNRPVPEAELFDGELPPPDHLGASVQLDFQKPDVELSRANQGSLKLELTADHPGANVFNAAGALLQGDVPGTISAAGKDAKLTATYEDIQRRGLKEQHQLTFEGLDVFMVQGILNVESGRDDVQNRRQATLTG
jgi:hypothetical protein